MSKSSRNYGIAPTHKTINMSLPMLGLSTFAVFCFCYLPVHWFLAGSALSGINTVAALFECMGIGMLVVQTICNASTEGISANSLELKLLALIFRLSNSVWLNGYLPIDATGDWLFQTLDLLYCEFAVIRGITGDYRKLAVIPRITANSQ